MPDVALELLLALSKSLVPQRVVSYFDLRWQLRWRDALSKEEWLERLAKVDEVAITLENFPLVDVAGFCLASQSWRRHCELHVVGKRTHHGLLTIEVEGTTLARLIGPVTLLVKDFDLKLDVLAEAGVLPLHELDVEWVLVSG